MDIKEWFLNTKPNDIIDYIMDVRKELELKHNQHKDLVIEVCELEVKIHELEKQLSNT